LAKRGHKTIYRKSNRNQCKDKAEWYHIKQHYIQQGVKNSNVFL